MHGRVSGDLVHGHADMVAQRHVVAGGRVDIHGVHAKTAGLEAVVGVDEVVVLLGHEGLRVQEPRAERLHEASQRGGTLDGQWRVEHPDLDGAELGLGADVPVKVLHALDHTGAGHLVEVGGEIVPGQCKRRAARQGKREHRVEPRRVERRVLPLHIGAGGRQRNEMRDVARHAVQHQERGVGIGAANVHMLAKDGELLGEVAIQLRQLLKAWLVVDAPLVPLLERVRAAAHHGNVELVGALDQRIADGGELAQHLAGRMTDAGGDFDHAVRHLGHYAAGQRHLFHQAQHVFGVGGQVVVVGVDELQFQLDAQRQRFGMGKGFKTHCGLHCRRATAGPKVWNSRPRGRWLPWRSRRPALP